MPAHRRLCPRPPARLHAHPRRHAEHLRVCSHRGRLAAEGVASGSLAAYPVLHKGGVRCFDIDFLQAADGALLATHPEDLQAALAGKLEGDAGLHSLAELRAAGASKDRIPTADALIKVGRVGECASACARGAVVLAICRRVVVGVGGGWACDCTAILRDKFTHFCQFCLENLPQFCMTTSPVGHLALLPIVFHSMLGCPCTLLPVPACPPACLTG
jgi:hypothetical protein